MKHTDGLPPDLAFRQNDLPLPHPELYKGLLEWRAETADKQHVRPWEVLTNISMEELVTSLPTNNRHLLSIKGIGKGIIKRYGAAILKIIENFSREENISVNLASDSVAPKRPSSDTKSISLEMFEAGRTIDEIVRLRTLARTTIEGHLAFYVGEGRLDVDRVLTPKKNRTSPISSPKIQRPRSPKPKLPWAQRTVTGS